MEAGIAAAFVIGLLGGVHCVGMCGGIVGTPWGWLPCSLVYSLLATALLSGSAAGGAAVMPAFGIGTLPNLLLAGMAVKRLRDLTFNRRLRKADGGLVAAFGFVGRIRVTQICEHIRQGMLAMM